MPGRKVSIASLFVYDGRPNLLFVHNQHCALAWLKVGGY